MKKSVSKMKVTVMADHELDLLDSPKLNRRTSKLPREGSASKLDISTRSDGGSSALHLSNRSGVATTTSAMSYTLLRRQQGGFQSTRCRSEAIGLASPDDDRGDNYHSKLQRDPSGVLIRSLSSDFSVFPDDLEQLHGTKTNNVNPKWSKSSSKSKTKDKNMNLGLSKKKSKVKILDQDIDMTESTASRSFSDYDAISELQPSSDNQRYEEEAKTASLTRQQSFNPLSAKRLEFDAIGSIGRSGLRIREPSGSSSGSNFWSGPTWVTRCVLILACHPARRMEGKTKSQNINRNNIGASNCIRRARQDPEYRPSAPHPSSGSRTQMSKELTE